MAFDLATAKPEGGFDLSTASPVGEPAAVRAGRGLMEIPRQVGLAARYAMEGIPSVADMLATPFRVPIEMMTGRQVTQAGGEGGYGSKLADLAGLPKPEGANERVVGDASRLVASSAGMAGAAKAAAGALQGVPQAVANALAASPGQQAIGAAAAGGAGGSVREAGGGAGAQFGAALAAGLAAPLAAMSARNVYDAAGRLVRSAFNPQQVDVTLRTELGKQGINWDDLAANVRSQLRDDARKAVYSGQPMDAEALGRLVDYRKIGATPLVGDLTQDPSLLTQQRNLSKQLANSTIKVMGGDLPSIQNENAQKVLGTLQGAAKSPLDEYATAQGIISSVKGSDAAAKAGVGALYEKARDAAGRSLPLDGAAFTRTANEMLKQKLAPKLGAEVDAALNDIATGKTPLTVEYAEQLKTMLGRKAAAAKATQGDLAYAYGLVRKALDETPIAGAAQVNSANLPATLGSVPPSVASAGQDAIDAFNAARSAAKTRFQWQESAPFIEDALAGMAPDKFVQKHVIGAAVGDLAKLKDQIADNAPLLDATRRQLVDYVMKRGSADPAVTKFSGAGLEEGLKALGDRKLALFFSPEEIAQLKAAVNVAKLSQSQPIGSAVNNSNTAAMLLGRASDLIGKTTGVPVLGPMFSTPAQSLMLRAQTIPLRDLSNALSPGGAPQLPSMMPLSMLLAAPGAQGGQDDRGR